MAAVSRSLILGLFLSVLLVGVAPAGPTRTDGDPDRPQITLPDAPRSDSTDARAGATDDTVAVETRVEVKNHWQVVLRAYLRWIRVFTL